ncbi:MAG: BlaI/MecI/CopY family transcriptional regulator [Acidobacteria bacterium]|nr:BlaI/MecI/CopY family transcriptional regulator [Acidobacteriota bacterium]
MAKAPVPQLSRRERQIMDVLYRSGRATAAAVQAGMPDPPSYSAVRTMLRILEDKGHVRHEPDGPRYVYIPTVARDKAKRSALKHVINTFFDGSASQVMAALFELSPRELGDEELGRLRQLIDEAKKEKKAKV